MSPQSQGYVPERASEFRIYKERQYIVAKETNSRRFGVGGYRVLSPLW